MVLVRGDDAVGFGAYALLVVRIVVEEGAAWDIHCSDAPAGFGCTFGLSRPVDAALPAAYRSGSSNLRGCALISTNCVMLFMNGFVFPGLRWNLPAQYVANGLRCLEFRLKRASAPTM